MRNRILPLLLFAVAGCQVVGGSADRGGADLPAAHSRLVLNKELTLRVGTAHTTLQGGRVVDGSQFNRYDTYCQLEVRKVATTPRRIVPDEFIIRRAYQETQSASVGGPIHVAGRGGLAGSGPSHFVYRTIFDLAASRQPDVRWMFCEQWGDPALGRHPTLDEIRIALGDYFTLKPPAGGG